MPREEEGQETVRLINSWRYFGFFRQKLIAAKETLSRGKLSHAMISPRLRVNNAGIKYQVHTDQNWKKPLTKL